MRTFSKYLFLFTVLAVLLNSCSIEETKAELNQNTAFVDEYKISQAEALEIAENFFGVAQQVKSTQFDIDYILSESMSLGTVSTVRDTVAYVMNMIDDGGFIIVSADNRCYPILAFSETGNFEYEAVQDDMVYANFVSLIDDYVASIDEIDAVPPSGEVVSYEEIDITGPMLYTKWSQGEPYNKYVDEYYPNCPVGCVAVAAGQIMVYCKPTLEDYHGMTFHLASINKAFERSLRPDICYPIGPPFPSYTYDVAIDYSAKLLYYIGQDVDMSYSPGGSGASSSDAYLLFKNLGFVLEEDGLTSYSGLDIAYSIIRGNIVYMRGSVVNGYAGHAWVADGCGTIHMGYRTHVFLHCNWGWGGRNDGYYTSDVFSAGGYSFSGMQYFSVKNENQI